MSIRQIKRAPIVAVVAIAALTLAACGGNNNGGGTTPGGNGGGSVSGPVVIDGSSTVEPLSAAAAELFQNQNSGATVTVGTSGTGGGFKKFCNAETDISNASRPIKGEETKQCEEKKVAYSELQVANDALTVVVSKDNTWVDCLTVAQLKRIWEPTSTIKNWNELDPKFPAEPMALYGAGADSGTFDYFTAAINGKEGDTRKDYNPTEDDNITIQGVSGSKGALGYFGFSYYEEAKDKLKALKIDEGKGKGCVEPSLATTQDGSYSPLARPLFIYVSDAGLKKPQVVKFADFYLASNDEIVKAAKFVPMTDEQKAKAKAALDSLKAKAGSK